MAPNPSPETVSMMISVTALTEPMSLVLTRSKLSIINNPLFEFLFLHSPLKKFPFIFLSLILNWVTHLLVNAQIENTGTSRRLQFVGTKLYLAVTDELLGFK